jgi:hypothetical protein
MSRYLPVLTGLLAARPIATSQPALFVLTLRLRAILPLPNYCEGNVALPAIDLSDIALGSL